MELLSMKYAKTNFFDRKPSRKNLIVRQNYGLKNENKSMVKRKQGWYN